MARIRSIHPGLFTDEAFVSCPPLARLLLLGIWTEADDYGVFEWKPITLKMRLLAADMADMNDLMGDLKALDTIKPVTIDGKAYGLVRNFCRYQRPKLPTHRVEIPKEFYTYVGLNPDGSRPNALSGNVSSPERRKPLPIDGEVCAQMKEEGGRRKEKGKEKPSNHIDKPVVVVVPPSPEIPAGTTTTTKVENDLVSQAEPAKPPVNPLGTALSEEWIPDESCMKIAFDSGMSGAEVESEVMRFHALNAQRGTFSQNWDKTWTLWCAEFKRRKAKETAKAPPRVEVSNGSPFVPNEKQWEGAAKLFAQNGHWHVDYGPEPTSPACRCPPDILAKYIVNHAAVPVLAARAAHVPA